MGDFDPGKVATDAAVNTVKGTVGLVPRWVDEYVCGLMNSEGPESTSSRVKREFDLLHEGMAQGITQSINEAKANPGDLVFKAGVAAAIAIPVCFALPRVIGNRAASIVVESLAWGGTAGVVFDDAKHVSTIGSAFNNYWNNPQQLESNKSQIAAAAGPLVLDSAVFSLGTRMGGGIASRFNSIAGDYSRFRYSSLTSKPGGF